MMHDNDGLQRMEEAVDLFLEWKGRPDREDAESFLAAHPDLHELLEAMLEDEKDTRTSDGRGESEHEDGAGVRPTSSAPEPKTFGDFRLLHELGRGGMGVVYEAEQRSLDRRVALKVLPAAFAQEARAITRFKREATTAARLEHPGIVRVLAVGAHDGVPYYAMERIDGVPLNRVLAHMREHGKANSGPELAEIVQSLLDAQLARSATQRTRASRWKDGYLETLVAVAIDVCASLAHAHEAGIVHRDVKPSNLMMRPDGSVVLTDFGLAREYGLPSATLTGEFAGTPHCVSPEQARGQNAAIGPASDVFSFGATLYEILTLEKAFAGASTHEVLEVIRRKDVPDPTGRHGVPADLAAILLKCLEKDPERRYPDCAAVQRDLESFRSYRPVTARRPGAVARVRRLVRRRPLESSLVCAALVTAGLATYLVATSNARSRGEALVREELVQRELERGFIETFARREKVASKHFFKVLDLDACNIYALGGLLFSTSHGRRGGAAHARLQTAIDLQPENRALRRFEIVKLFLDGKRDACIALSNSLGEPYSADECVAAAFSKMPSSMSILGAGGMGEAASLLRKAIGRSHRANLLHYIQWATAIGRAKNPGDVRDVNTTLEILWPDSAIATAVRGMALHFHDPQAAITAYRRALELDDSLILGYTGLATVFASLNKPEEALEACARGLALAPDLAELYHVRGSQLGRLKRYDEAIQAVERAIELLPRSATYHAELAFLVERNVDKDDADAVRAARTKALAHARRSAKISPFYGRAHRGIAALCRLLGDARGEREEYQRWLRMHPGGAWAHMEYARFLLDQAEPSQGDRRRALRAANTSNRLHPNDSGLMHVLARALAANGKRDEAQSVIESARKHLPADPKERQPVAGELDALQAQLGR